LVRGTGEKGRKGKRTLLALNSSSREKRGGRKKLHIFIGAKKGGKGASILNNQKKLF